MIPRRLVITVGTSLFQSASWRCEGALAGIDGYARWCDPERQADPSKRRAWSDSTSSASAIEDQIRNLVMATPESPDLVEKFETSFAEPFARYSAEITTLLQMRRRLNPHSSFRAFLNEYESINFLHGVNRDPTAAAAGHLAAVLRAYTEHRNIETRALEGTTIQRELKGLVKFLQNLPNEPADLVASGGYKAFAVALGHAYLLRSDEGWRLFYLHESDTGQLVQEWKEAGKTLVGVGADSFEWPEPPHL